MKPLQDLCLHLATRIREGRITPEELVIGLQQAWDALPEPRPGTGEDERIRRARGRLGMLLRAARSESGEERRDLKGAAHRLDADRSVLPVARRGLPALAFTA